MDRNVHRWVHSMTSKQADGCRRTQKSIDMETKTEEYLEREICESGAKDPLQKNIPEGRQRKHSQ